MNREPPSDTVSPQDAGDDEMNKGITAPNRELIGHRVTGSRLQEVFLLLSGGEEDDGRAIVIEPGGELEVSVFDVAGEAMCGQIDLMPGWAVSASFGIAEKVRVWGRPRKSRCASRSIF